MRAAALAGVAAVLVAALAVDARPATVSCVRTATAEHNAFVQQATGSGWDVWGGRLLRAPGGPTLARARQFLPPLTGGMQWAGRPLAPGGSYYVPFSFPFTQYGSTVFALHVADGSAIVTRRVGGASLSFFVGNGGEAYGSCAPRLQRAKLAQGWLPILQTGYTDAAGAKYRQESFVGRAFGAYGARSVISYVKLAVDARHAKRDVTVRLVPWRRLPHTAADRLALGGATRLIVSDGGEFVQGVVRYRVPKGETHTVYLAWLNAPSDARYVKATAQTYETARNTVVSFWTKRLDTSASIEVPEPAVQNAMRGILTQVIGSGWRYSIGNPYEELSYAESLDAAEVAVEFGYPEVAKQIIEFAQDRMRVRPWRFTAFRGSRILSGAAAYYRLTGDRAFLRAETPALAKLMGRIAERKEASGRLAPEPLSTDLEGKNVYSVPGQATSVAALRAIGREWSRAGYPVFAKRARSLSTSINAALRPAVNKARTRMKDGSVFVPEQLGAKQKPYPLLTSTREGSYWNLVMPYAFASGWFPPHTRESRGIIRYLLRHGARMLGVPRTYARTVYGRPGAGLAQVYGLSTSRFLADNDQPDQLVLSLYGMLAVGMTDSTFVSGEAVSVLPVRGSYYRTMFMPPNSGANASFLETLRLLLVHERRGPAGAPAGLDLAFATPRAWLADGKSIEVRSLPTSFGKVSYTLTRAGSVVKVHAVLPSGAHARLRVRSPERMTTLDLGDRRGAVDLTVRVAG